jgi:hypothetical protein
MSPTQAIGDLPARRSREPLPRVLAFAAVSLKLAAAIRQALPVEGQPWPRAGDSEEQAMAPVAELLPAFAACWWVRDGRVVSSYRPLAKGWQTLNPPPEDPEALLTLIRCWQRVFGHYGWGINPFISSWHAWIDRRRQPWRWPDVPRIPPEALDDVERAARALAPPSLTQPAQAATPPGKGKPRGKRPRLTTSQADQKARELDKAMGWDFRVLAETEQAKLIGCHRMTWRKTDFYAEAERKGLFRKRPSRRKPGNSTPTTSLTDAVEAREGAIKAKRGQGRENAQLKQLIADHEANKEPSPLDPDPPDARKKKARKRT